MIGFIYITTNKVNGKKYLGRKAYKKGWEIYLGSSKQLLADIKLFGKENFERTIIEECDGFKTLSEREVFYQKKFNVKSDPGWYNIVIANEGFDTTGSRFTYSTERLAKIWTEERRAKQRKRMLDKSINPNYNVMVSKQRSKRMKTENPSFRKEVKEKLSNIKSRPFTVKYNNKLYTFKNNREALNSEFGNAAVCVKKVKIKRNNPFKGLSLS